MVPEALEGKLPLLVWLDAHGTPQQVALRGRIILSSADGKGDGVVARELGVNCKTVTLWRVRWRA